MLVYSKSSLLSNVAINKISRECQQSLGHTGEHTLGETEHPSLLGNGNMRERKLPIEQSLRLGNPVILELQKTGVAFFGASEVKCEGAVRFRSHHSVP